MSQQELCPGCKNVGRTACKLEGLSFSQINALIAQDPYTGIDCPQFDELYAKALEEETGDTKPSSPAYPAENFPHLVPQPRDTREPQLGLGHPDSIEEIIQCLALRDRGKPSIIHEKFNIPDFLRSAPLPIRYHAVFHRVIATRGDYPKEMSPRQANAFLLWSEGVKRKSGIGGNDSSLRQEFDFLENFVVGAWINQQPDGEDMITLYKRP